MKLSIAAFLFALATQEAVAFTTPATTKLSFHRVKSAPTKIYNSSPEQQTVDDGEIVRLRSMAQKLRAEAAALEADRAQELAVAAENAFRKFDIDQDGEISLEELKAGLEKALKTELPDSRVQQIMDDFDVSGDGKLQLDEFVGVDRFRNRLESLAREEKEQALNAAKSAQKEAETAKLLEARMSLINDGAPTTGDKFVSVLPYLFPLLDSLQFGRFIIEGNTDNPFVVVLALLYTLYRSIPFSGFVAFLALNVLSGNPGLNRLVRFNMQQAIFLDIALFFPGLIGAVLALIAGGTGTPLPPAVTELGSDVVFGVLILTVAYASISSLLGITPDKIPLISKSVDDRMPTVDMFDESGQFVPREAREKKDEKDDKKD